MASGLGSDVWNLDLLQDSLVSRLAPNEQNEAPEDFDARLETVRAERMQSPESTKPKPTLNLPPKNETINVIKPIKSKSQPKQQPKKEIITASSEHLSESKTSSIALKEKNTETKMSTVHLKRAASPAVTPRKRTPTPPVLSLLKKPQTPELPPLTRGVSNNIIQTETGATTQGSISSSISISNNKNNNNDNNNNNNITTTTTKTNNNSSSGSSGKLTMKSMIREVMVSSRPCALPSLGEVLSLNNEDAPFVPHHRRKSIMSVSTAGGSRSGSSDSGKEGAVKSASSSKLSRRRRRRRARRGSKDSHQGVVMIPMPCNCYHEFPPVEKSKLTKPGDTAVEAPKEKEKYKGWIEEKISIDTLEELKKTFASADVNRTGCLDLDDFKNVLRQQLRLSPSKEAQIDSLFMKIDWSSEGNITWNEFCTYMQLEYAEKEDSYLRDKEVAFHLPAKIENIPHRDPILRITNTSDGSFVACSQEGTVSFWSPSTEIKKIRSVINQELNNRTKPKWITDFCLMPHFNKFLVGTGDREIQFFELSSFEPYCQISGLETVPLKLDYSFTGYDECLILFGDSAGCVNILVIKSAGECLRTWWKMPKHDGFIASISLDAVINGGNVKFIRWQVHDGEWVGQLKYYHEIGQVISCSNNSNKALVIGSTIGSTHVESQLKEIKDMNTNQERSRVKYTYNQAKTRLEADETVFKVYKGVKVFDFSKAKTIIVTGGMDRIIRLWNPYVCGKPTAMLRGHTAPIFYLFIADEDNRIFSISTDRCIKVWDIQDHTCLLTIRPKSHKIRGDLQAIHYCGISRSLAVATDQMAVLNLRHKAMLNADMVITHKEPVTCCKYNPEFKQVITCCNGSVIKLWDFETGAAIFEYGEAHGEEAITCMTMDNTGRRLITGGRDGILRIWNYNNGHCLRVLKKKSKRSTESKSDEICDVTYIEMNKNRYVISVGWDRRINIYYDSLSDNNIHHVQHPTPYWHDDIKDGHKEDVLAIAQCLPNLLATASYDGEVIVWNMVSGHIFCHLHAPPPPEYEDQFLDGDLSISKLLFLHTRAYKKDAGTLIASGPRAHIHVWNVFQGGSLMAQFKGSKLPSGMVSFLVSNKNNSLLYTSDSLGFIYVWNIADYCLTGPADEPPECIHQWRGHIESITSMDLVESSNVLITASNDCTARLWTTEGHYIGTLGQPDPWDLHNPATFQHPMVPYDVLVDPMSLPSHPLFLEKQTTMEIIHQDSEKTDEDDKNLRSVSPAVTYGNKQTYVVDDDMINNMLASRPFDYGTGKRLRFTKNKKVKVDWGGPSEYQMLHCYPLDVTPQPTPPTFKVNKDDPFDFYID